MRECLREATRERVAAEVDGLEASQLLEHHREDWAATAKGWQGVCEKRGGWRGEQRDGERAHLTLSILKRKNSETRVQAVNSSATR